MVGLCRLSFLEPPRPGLELPSWGCRGDIIEKPSKVVQITTVIITIIVMVMIEKMRRIVIVINDVTNLL